MRLPLIVLILVLGTIIYSGTDNVHFDIVMNSVNDVKEYFNLENIHDVLYFNILSCKDILVAYYLPTGEARLAIVYIDFDKNEPFKITEIGAAGVVQLDYNENNDCIVMYWHNGFYCFRLHNKNSELISYLGNNIPDIAINYQSIEPQMVKWISDNSFIVEYYSYLPERHLVRDTLEIILPDFKKE